MDYIRTDENGQLVFEQSTEFLQIPSCLFGFHILENDTKIRVFICIVRIYISGISAAVTPNHFHGSALLRKIVFNIIILVLCRKNRKTVWHFRVNPETSYGRMGLRKKHRHIAALSFIAEAQCLFNYPLYHVLERNRLRCCLLIRRALHPHEISFLYNLFQLLQTDAYRFYLSQRH